MKTHSMVLGAAVALSLLAGLPAGCSSPGSAGGSAAANSPLRGWVLELKVTNPASNLYIRYKLVEPGVLTYWAGSDQTPRWSGQISSQELVDVADLLDANPDPQRTPTITNPGPDGREYDFTAKSATQVFATKFHSGPTPFLVQLNQMLQNAVLQRFQDEFIYVPPKEGD
ncbi:MAG: hypothetical protein KF745_14810 [Phycisphaeraceae bacterium]|nr:hypothetical protein [Phycisphaeraceae bacterium]